MKHAHKYEPIYHPGLTSEAKELGMKAAEIKKCTVCQKEMTFVLTKNEKWIPLFEDKEPDTQDILLA